MCVNINESLIISVYCGKDRIRTYEPILSVTRFPGVPLQPLEHLSFNELRLLQITICMYFACNLRFFATFHKCGAKLHVLSQFLKFFARYFPLNLTIYISLTNIIAHCYRPISLSESNKSNLSPLTSHFSPLKAPNYTIVSSILYRGRSLVSI